MTAAPASTISKKVVIWLLAGMGVLILIGANSHLVYVASISQPDCVAHLRETGSSGQFRAAISSCTPANQVPRATAETGRR